jgi:ribosomal protein S12 methylthiotransferase
MARPSGPAGRAVGVISLGCPKNLVDTEVMLGLLAQAGYRIVPTLEDADTVLVNTCCFIASAREEAASALEEAISWRNASPERALICAGCWPELEAEELRRRFPEVDAFMGPGDVPAVVSILEQARARSGPGQPTAAPESFLYNDVTPRLRATAPWTAYLKIAEGCRHRCRYCIIPRLRGPYRSRPLASIVAEARRLVAEGVRELNLIAQDTTAYGADLREDSADLADLLAALGEIEDLHWIRLLYGYPTSIKPRLIAAMAEQERVCKYLDLPFQHADRAVLRRMGRPGDSEAYLKLIGQLRAAMPDIALRSSFIVGYPGETKEEFAHLLDFIEAAELDRAAAFPFSPERGTPAAELPDQVPAELAQERFHEFMVRQQRISLARNQRWLGRELEVLVEAPGERRGEWLGRSFRDAPEIDGLVHIHRATARTKPGQFLRVKITEAKEYDIAGTVQR